MNVEYFFCNRDNRKTVITVKITDRKLKSLKGQSRNWFSNNVAIK